MFQQYPDILTVQQVADALRISKASVYRLIHDKQLGCKHIGRKIIVPKVCLMDYVKSARYTVCNSGQIYPVTKGEQQ